jgi:hypothetical protein
MGRRRFASVLLLALASSALAACGGDGGGEEEGKGEAKIACEGAPLGSEPNLPAGFPKPAETTYFDSKKQGPSLVVDGFYEGDLEKAYEEYKEGFEGSGYTILFDELEENDSEISYRDPDEATSGQVALRRDCEEDGRIAVHITNRPA